MTSGTHELRAREEIAELADEAGLTNVFSAECEAEVARWLMSPGTDDPALIDSTHLAFVTIDNEDSRDLDQALFVETLADGHRVHYALADASYYVRPGSHLYGEAIRRGASYYLPGLVVPMLPVELSEGLVSLNPGVVRRAVVFVIDLDGRGEVVSTRIERQRIKSCAKLSYGGVQRLWDDRDAGRPHHLENQSFTVSLFALREVGRRRIAIAEDQGVVHYPRIEVDIGFTDAAGRSFHVFESLRYECDRANEQLSLLVNVEGAKLLAAHTAGVELDPLIEAVYRVHPAPEKETLAAFARLSRVVIERHGLDSGLAWSRQETLAAWLSRLTQTLGRHPVALALQRQALLVNQRSTYAPEPGLHYGVGAPCYARFSSPMREVVGIHTHREALEAMGFVPPTPVVAGELEAIVDAANRSKDLQHTLTQRANRLVLESLFTGDLAYPENERPRRMGTVMGLGRDRLFVLLDTPPLEVKVYSRDLGEDVSVLEDGLVVDGMTFALGDRVQVRVERHDPASPPRRIVLSARVVR